MGVNSGCLVGLWVVHFLLSNPFDPGGCVVRIMYLGSVRGDAEGVFLLRLMCAVVHHCNQSWRRDRRIQNSWFVRVSIGIGFLTFILWSRVVWWFSCSIMWLVEFRSLFYFLFLPKSLTDGSVWWSSLGILMQMGTWNGLVGSKLCEWGEFFKVEIWLAWFFMIIISPILSTSVCGWWGSEDSFVQLLAKEWLGSITLSFMRLFFLLGGRHFMWDPSVFCCLASFFSFCFPLEVVPLEVFSWP